MVPSPVFRTVFASFAAQVVFLLENPESCLSSFDLVGKARAAATAASSSGSRHLTTSGVIFGAHCAWPRVPPRQPFLCTAAFRITVYVQAIFHLEAFVAKFMSIYKRFLLNLAF
jgi:hypothetical protein